MCSRTFWGNYVRKIFDKYGIWVKEMEIHIYFCTLFEFLENHNNGALQKFQRKKVL